MGAVSLLENVTIRIWKAGVALRHVYQERKKKGITQESLQQTGWICFKTKTVLPTEKSLFSFSSSYYKEITLSVIYAAF